MEIEMEFRNRILLLWATQAIVLSAYAGEIEIDSKGANTTVLAIVEPSPASIGKPLNVWVGAVYNGVPYFYNGAGWVRYINGPLPVAAKEVTLGIRNKIAVAKGTDLSLLPGADLYIGYGKTEEAMMSSSEGKLRKVGELAKKLR
jgi:hypothetical protein